MKRAIAIFILILSTPAYADFLVCKAEKQVLIELNTYGVGTVFAGETSSTFIVAGQQVKSTDDSEFLLSGCKTGKYPDEVQCEMQDEDRFDSFWVSRFLGFTFRTRLRSSQLGNDLHIVVMGQCKKFSE